MRGLHGALLPALGAAHDATRVTAWQRARMIFAQLASFEGGGGGRARVINVLVSYVGILGMFSAIIGALLGAWIVGYRDDAVADDDGFAFWETDDAASNSAGSGCHRELQYSLVRLVET